MPIGRRALAIGPRIGSQVGFASEFAAQLLTVTRDATSGILCPATAAEAATALSVAGSSGSPLSIWTCQDASGNLADAVSSLTLTRTGTAPLYQQTIAGWSRKGITGADAATTVFASTNAALPDPATTSYLILMYATVAAAPAANRSMVFYGTALQTFGAINVTPALRIQGLTSSNGTQNLTGGVRPFVLQYDRAANRSAWMSNAEQLIVGRRASTGKGLNLQLLWPGSILYKMMITGSAAEISDGRIKSILQTFGWSVSW